MNPCLATYMIAFLDLECRPVGVMTDRLGQIKLGTGPELAREAAKFNLVADAVVAGLAARDPDPAALLDEGLPDGMVVLGVLPWVLEDPPPGNVSTPGPVCGDGGGHGGAPVVQPVGPPAMVAEFEIPRGNCRRFMTENQQFGVPISRADFDALAGSGRFRDGPYRDTFGDGEGEPYNPRRQAFGALLDGTCVYCEMWEE